MNHLILRMTAITVAILSIAVLDGIVSGQTAPWTGLFTIAALLGMAAYRVQNAGERGDRAGIQPGGGHFAPAVPG